LTPITAPAPDSLSEILTPEELAALLRVTPSWVNEKTRRRAKNPLPALRIGRYIRFRRSDVIAWLDGTRAVKKRGR
jgi:excisionase family DNA binding protein